MSTFVTDYTKNINSETSYSRFSTCVMDNDSVASFREPLTWKSFTYYPYQIKVNVKFFML